MTRPNALEVRLHGVPIGTVTWLDGDRTIFAFQQAYADDVKRPTLGLNFKDASGQLITEHRVYQTRLMPFFSNLLPEGHLRRYLASRAGVKLSREFFLLQALGMDLPGAVTVSAVDNPAVMIEKNDESNTDVKASSQSPLRFSLAGVQLKFSGVIDSHGGLTIPAKGTGGSWIVKLPSSQYARVPENEFSMMTLARQVGIDVPDFHLIDMADVANLPEGVMFQTEGKAFAIRRFDRLDDGQSVHIEDFAQVFGVYPENKYDRASARNIVDVIANECGLDDVAEFIRRLTFNTLIGNADMHLKNWSLIYPDGRQPAIAPAYDFVSTVVYIPDDKAALKVSRSARFDEFTEEELTHLADKARLPTRRVLDVARETVDRVHDAWASERNNLPLSREVIDRIDRHIRKVSLS